MVVAVLAGLTRDVLDQFAVDARLLALPVILHVLALEAAAVGDVAPVPRLAAFLQEEGLLLGLDGLVGAERQ